MTYIDGNPGHGFRQEQKCGRVKSTCFGLISDLNCATDYIVFLQGISHIIIYQITHLILVKK